MSGPPPPIIAGPPPVSKPNQKLVKPANPRVIPPPEGKIDYVKEEGPNPDRDWITYESIYNYEKFRHTKGVVPTGAYQMPLRDVRVIASSGLTDGRLELLRQAFFPQMDLTALKSILYRPWMDTPDGKWDLSLEKIFTDKMQTRDEFATLPYNVVANNYDSVALGTRALGASGETFDFRKLDGDWPSWQTASRSCVIRLDSTEGAIGNALQWNFRDGREKEPTVSFQATNPNIVPIKTPFNFFAADKSGDQWKRCFGFKTGVSRVGQDWLQGGTESSTGGTMGGKGILEKESIAAALRSEYFNDITKMYKKSQANDPAKLIDKIIILPEVLTVTCNNERIDRGVRDGFQLRDISLLDPSKKYFPPLSIPFIGFPKVSAGPADPLDFGLPSTLFSAIEEPDKRPELWRKYWTESFAKPIGQAKAILHLNYGLQCLTPNAQNFLLQFDDTKMEKVNKVVLRDVLDMKLHPEWIQTVMGQYLDIKKNRDPAPLESSLVEVFKKIRAAPVFKTAADLQKTADDGVGLSRLLSFEATVPSPVDPTNALLYDSEIHESLNSKGDIQYYSGTQLNFINYTALLKGSSIETPSVLAPGGDKRPPKWNKVLYANFHWAFYHAEAYLQVIKDYIKFSPDLIQLPPITIGALPLKITPPPLKITATAGSDIAAKYGTFLDEKGVVVDPSLLTDATKNANFDFWKNAETCHGLTDDAAGWKRAGQLHELFWAWERAVSDQIHNILYGSVLRRQNLRRYIWGKDMV